MKYFTLTLTFVFCAMFANAQLSANNYTLDDWNSDESTISQSSENSSDAELSDLEGNDFNKKRRRKKRRGRRGGPDNILKTNLTNLVFMSPTITYERKLSDEMSAGGSLIFTSYDWGGMGWKLSGPKVFLDFKYYTGGEAPTRFYIGGFLFFTLVDFSTLVFHQGFHRVFHRVFHLVFQLFGTGFFTGFFT